jgi:hypothetical protein
VFILQSGGGILCHRKNKYIEGNVFEPNSTKDNRGSVWVMTMTIAAPTNNYHTSYNTYVVAVGKKWVDHTPVYDRVMADLEELATYDRMCLYYSKVGGNVVWVSCGMNNYLSDQPEKRSLTGFGGGNANGCPQYGKWLQVKLMYKVLVPCVMCVYELRAGYLPTHYVNCACWDTSSSLLEIPAPENYPKN